MRIERRMRVTSHHARTTSRGTRDACLSHRTIPKEGERDMTKVHSVFGASGGSILLGVFVLATVNGCQDQDTTDVEAATQAVQARVTICHKGRSITVAEPAVPAHLAHGDTVGACEDGGAD